MAVRFNASGEAYTASAALGARTAMTVCTWAKISVDRNALTTIWSIDNGAADYFALKTTSTGTSARAMTDSGVHATHELTVGVWYFLGVAFGASGGRFIVRAEGAAGFTAYNWATASSVTAANLRIGVWPGGTDWLNGCVAGFKAWTAELTQAQIETEYAALRAVRTADLVAGYVFDGPSVAPDSGSITLTGGSGSSQEAGPAVPLSVGSVAGWGIPIH